MLELYNTQKVKLTFNTASVNDVSISCDIKSFDNDRIYLEFPEENKNFIKDFPEGKEIGVLIYTNSGIFIFDSIVINSPLEQDFVIELPDEKKKIQRREYLRAPMKLKLNLNKDDVNYEVQTINIGGGGIRFVAQEQFNINDLWGFSFVLPQGDEIKGVGKILYTILQGKNIVSVITFNSISETERNKLIKLCFDEEIKNLNVKRD